MSISLCCYSLCIHHKSTQNGYFWFHNQVPNCVICQILIRSFCMSWLVYLSPLLNNIVDRFMSSFACYCNSWTKFDSLSSSPRKAIPWLARYCKDSMILAKQHLFSSFAILVASLAISIILLCDLGITISYSVETLWHSNVWSSWNRSKAFFQFEKKPVDMKAWSTCEADFKFPFSLWLMQI